MAEEKKINQNKENSVSNVTPVSLQKNLPPRPLPARPAKENLSVAGVKQENLNSDDKIEQKPKNTVRKQAEKTKVKKEKIQKPKEKKQKQKKEKKAESKENTESAVTKDPKKKKKYIKFYLIASLVVVLGILVTVIWVTASVRARENAQIAMMPGSAVEVVAFNNQYFLQVPENEEAYYYIFEITNNQNPVLIFSRTNQIDVSSYFQQRTIFTLKYYLQRQSEKSRSQGSLSIDYVVQEQLSIPLLRLNEETNKLEWNYISNAASYVFYYASGEQILTYEYFPPFDDDDNIGSYMPALEYGVYNISLVAKPSNALYYISSEQSNIITVTKYSTQEQVLNASYSLSNQTVSIDASNLDEENHNFAIHIGLQVLYFTPTIKQDNYVVNVVQHGLTITLGNVVSVVTLGDGEYLFDSEEKICTPNN